MTQYYIIQNADNNLFIQPPDTDIFISCTTTYTEEAVGLDGSSLSNADEEVRMYQLPQVTFTLQPSYTHVNPPSIILSPLFLLSNTVLSVVNTDRTS